MKLLRIVAGVCLLTMSLRGQQLVFPQAPPVPIANFFGTAGATSYFYWVAAHYPWGVSIPGGPGTVTNGNAALSALNVVNISWASMTGATSYDLLRTASSTPPTGGCNCALTIGTTATSYNDIGNALLTYTVATPGLVFPDASAQSSAAGGSAGGPTIIKLSEIDDTANALAVLKFVGVAMAVNQLTITSAATGNGVLVASTGTDATVPVTFNSKGAAAVTVAPGANGGTIVVGGTAQTGQITLGSSSGAETVVVAAGAGAPTVQIAHASTAGATVNIADAATATGNTDAVVIAGGNTAGTGAKTVSIAGGAPAGSGLDTVNIGTGNAGATAKKIVNIATGVPNTTGNNQVVVGGGSKSAVTANAVLSTYQDWNYIGTETGANNALVAALTDAAGNNVTVAAGLRISLKLAHSIQAGANTLNLNAHGTDSIKKTSNPATDLSVTAVNGSILTMIFDGTVWQVQGQ